MIGNCKVCDRRIRHLCWFCKRMVCPDHSDVVVVKRGAAPKFARGTYHRRVCKECQQSKKDLIRQPRKRSVDMPSNYADVKAFHDKFGLGGLRPSQPSLIQDPTLLDFRVKFMQEELDEFVKAHGEGDLPTAADSLIDLVYVVLGTADYMGLPWAALWDEVQRANMSKVRVDRETLAGSVRGSAFDVIKPPGWTPPDIAGVLQKHVEFQRSQIEHVPNIGVGSQGEGQ